jgi:uncharacterized protein (TIGR02246 family)
MTPRAAALALVLALAACESRRFGDADAREIEATLARQRDAWNRGDIDGFMIAYAKDGLVFTSGGQIRRGFDETLARYRERYADKGAMGTLAFSDLEITGLGADAALVLGRYALTGTPEAGDGVFTLVLRRSDEGAWTIVHDHTSASAPAK